MTQRLLGANMHSKYGVIVGMLTYFTLNTSYADIGIKSEFSFESYSDGIPVLEIIKDEPQKIKNGGELIYLHAYASLGYQALPNLAINIVERVDSVIHHSPDALEIYTRDKNDIDFLNKNHQIFLDFEMLRAKGLRLDYFNDLSHLKWLKQRNYHLTTEWQLELLKTSKLYSGVLNGTFLPNGNASQAKADLDWYYSKDSVLDRKVEEPSGRGFNINLHSLLTTPNSSHSLLIKDFYQQFKWKNSPHTQLSLNSSRVSQNTNGQYRPQSLASGIENYELFTQRLNPRIYFKHTFSSKQKNHWLLDTDYYAKQWWLNIGYSVKHKQQKYAIKYHIRESALSLSYGNKYFSLYVSSDNIKPKDAHHLNFNINLKL